MNILTFSLAGVSESRTRFTGSARQFRITIDEPPSLGGEDAAPNPLEYLLAGYAGCLNVVAHVVAREQGLPLRGLAIHVEGELDASRFLGKDTPERAGFRQIRVVIDPETDADPAALKHWLRTLEARCPAHDTLTRVTPVSLGLRLPKKLAA